MNKFRSLAALFACVSLFVTGCSVGAGQEGLGSSEQAIAQDDCPQSVTGSTECPCPKNVTGSTECGDDEPTTPENPFPGGSVDTNDDGDEETKDPGDSTGGDCPPDAAPVVTCNGVPQTDNNVKNTGCITTCVPLS